uniref:Reverse transcriptase N-terminal domain-containing protein n=1 Tax=Crouania attenuata TaxID=42002 RepID=A0A4D6WV16_9FLOR|nr:hypothetical protein [Crouania attenuata]
MTPSLLTIDTKWQNLPWHNIIKKIQFIQRKIYVFSKQCSYQKVIEYQNLLLNCNEAKVYAIESVCKYILEYYNNDKVNLYEIYRKEKFYFFQYLFKYKNINNKLNLLLQKIKQYLIYLCIQPEWETRFNNAANEPMVKIELSNICFVNNYYARQCFNLRNQRLTYSYNKYFLSYQYYTVYYLVDILNDVKHLSYDCINQVNQIIFDSNQMMTINNLNIKIYSNQIVWYKYISQDVLKSNRASDINIKIRKMDDDIIKSHFLVVIKSMIYRRSHNYFGLKKINISLNYLVYSIMNKMILLYKYLGCNLQTYFIQSINFLVNYIIYYWCKKKYQSNLIKHYFFKHNMILNKTMYIIKYASLYNLYLFQF